jgi:hypothetical protein
MSFRAREISTLFVVAPLMVGGAISACSSSDGGMSGTSSAALTLPPPNCESAGIHFESCGVGVGGGIHVDPPPPRYYCLENDACQTAPRTGSGFDPAWTLPPGATDWVQDVSDPATGHTSFSDQLVTFGCTAEKFYYPENSYPPDADGGGDGGPQGYGSLWATSFCPLAFFTANDDDAGTIDSDNAGMISCDTCTGAAPVGWRVVAWEVSKPPPPRNCFPERCPFGTGTCESMDCVQWGNSGTLVPVSAPPPVP